MSAIFSVSSTAVAVYDFIEITVACALPQGRNPFTDVELTGEFAPEGFHPTMVDGFCDSPDGAIFRIRFMPSRPGAHRFKLRFRDGSSVQTYEGKFTAVVSGRRGLLRVDPARPTHFLWEGTGEHYFWNGTTTYWLMGWQDDRIINAAIDRLAGLKVNRMRVAINGRTRSGKRWQEPLVVQTDRFSFHVDPWVAADPENIEQPGLDLTRFNVAFWQRLEKALRHAREKDIIFDIIFFLDGQNPGVDPFGKSGMGGPDEQRYYRYAAARLSAFSNITWDITNESRNFRTVEWVNQTGAMLKSFDPYRHITSCHGHEDFPFALSPWCDFVMYQRWDESGGHEFLVKAREEQAGTGHPKPIVNEEYGYEDHYPQGWGGARNWPARNADSRRRLAWEISMAGCYQTTGERANGGTGAGEDTGGGWVNGRGGPGMVMLEGYAHMVEFFTSIPWWRLTPNAKALSGGPAMLLAESGQRYVVYLPDGGNTFTLQLEAGKHLARWFNCRTGDWTTLGEIQGLVWTSPAAPDAGDWALLVERL